MPRKVTKAKAQATKQRVQRKKRTYRPAKNVPDFAQLSETFDISALATGVMYQKRDFTLNGNPRAQAVALAYQHYRIKKITMKFKPQIDTYISGSGTTVPNLHYMIDKSGSIPTNSTLAALKSMGAKPIRFDDKNITVSWRPSVLTDTATAPGVSGQSQYRISPWLSTNANALQPGVFVPSSIDHLGLFWFIETQGAAVGYTIEVTMEFQFKKPLNATIAGDTEATKV